MLSKHHHRDVLVSLGYIAQWVLRETSFFCSSPPNSSQSTEDVASRPSTCLSWANCQRGVTRTNCIDCLDRTNSAQFMVGACALGHALAATGVAVPSRVINSSAGIRASCVLESNNPLVPKLMELYSVVGDFISLQYGGSEAHKKIRSQQASASSGNGASQIDDISTAKHNEFLTSIRRYYSNAFTDRLKQDAINVFLGVYTPASDHVESLPLWELESDYYLHNFRVQNGTQLTMRVFQDTLPRSSDTHSYFEQPDDPTSCITQSSTNLADAPSHFALRSLVTATCRSEVGVDIPRVVVCDHSFVRLW